MIWILRGEYEFVNYQWLSWLYANTLREYVDEENVDKNVYKNVKFIIEKWFLVQSTIDTTDVS